MTTVPLTSEDVAREIRAALQRVAGVEQVAAWLSGNLWSVTVVVPEKDFVLEDHIYDEEAAVVRAFPTFEFDFEIIPRLGRPMEELISQAR